MKQKNQLFYTRLGELLKEYREAANLKQVDVALQLGKPQSFVSKIESSERRIDVVELIELLALYGRSLSEVENEIKHLAAQNNNIKKKRGAK